ncbi:MAG: hypothetical protein KGP14_10550 [Betaproteobacteria bacterium]|nr:hypothetical protein [Betaproteobacteria bacterium]
MTAKKSVRARSPHVHYSDELAETICTNLADGMSMLEICKLPGMPDRETVRRWAIADHAFAAKCARAREAQGDAVHDEIVEIERKLMKGEIDFQSARVVLSSKQWRAEKLAPKIYGNRMDHTSSDGSMAAPGFAMFWPKSGKSDDSPA